MDCGENFGMHHCFGKVLFKVRLCHIVFDKTAQDIRNHQYLVYCDYVSFYKVLRWCQRCWGASTDPMKLGTKRTRQDYLDTAQCLETFSGTFCFYVNNSDISKSLENC